MTNLVLDSQALLWFLDDDPKLSQAAAEAMSADDARWFVPAICVCEIDLTLRKGRGKYMVTSAELHRVLRSRALTTVVPVTYAIARRSVRLTVLDGIHDQLIVATTIRLRRMLRDLRLVTSDANIRAANLVPTIW